MDHNSRKLMRNSRNLFYGHFIKIKFKYLLFIQLCICVNIVSTNRPPRFLIDDQTEIVLRLKEGDETPVGSLIYKLHGIDPDGDPLKFGVKQQPGSDIIKVINISPNEAEVYLNRELDREERDEYGLVLTLTDGRLGQNNYITQSLLLLVEDVNDNTPIFKNHQSSLTLREDAKPGVIANLEATDADEGAYGQVIYHLQEIDTDDSSLFSVATISGKAIVRLIGQLDYEKQTLHQLKVLAVDRAKHGRVNTGTATLLVKVQDVEDQPPEFVRVTSVARIAENVPIGTSILQVTAIDGDRGVNNPIQYSLLSNTIDRISDIFHIDEHTGILRTSSVLDREALSSNSGTYILQISATELGSQIEPLPSATTEVTVMVTDINDETPKFKSNRYECEIAENAPVNTPVTFLGFGIPEVYDHDQGVNGTFQLYIKGAAEIFEITPTKIINEATFTIKVKNSTILDYERIKLINLTIVAKEIVKFKPKFNEVPVFVKILDRNDNYPEFTRDVYEVSVPENCNIGTTVATVKALDNDSGNFGTSGVRYTHLSGSIEHMLNLHPTSGVITVKTAGGPNWDREQINRHYLTVEARDDLGNGNRNTVQLIIDIEDVNDNAPVFVQSHYEARLLENKQQFENVLKVEARDADLNGTNNSKIKYSLFGELQNNFTIDPISGIIQPKQPIDFENFVNTATMDNVRPLYLTIRATDLGTPSLSSEVSLQIFVQDTNDHAPEFVEDFYSESIPENIPSGTSILRVKAIDLDGSSPNNQIVYRIQNGASDKFVIDAENGIISIARGASLDPDLTQPKRLHYSLNVLALDGATGDDQQHSSVRVNITILDVNNKNPVFDEPGNVVIRENTPVGTTIIQLQAKDLDSTASLRYYLNRDECEAKNERGVLLKTNDFDCNRNFAINQTTGILSVVKELDREIVETIRMGLIVEDIASEIGQQFDQTSILIHIDDINDNSPKFRQAYYKFSITENSKNGIFIGSIIADDADKDKTITYTLDGRYEFMELVHLNSDTGDLVVANRIDHEIYNWLNLTVKATDSGIPSRSSRTELFIQILDENDNNPYFLLEPRMLLISEDTPLNQQVAIIEAEDADSGEFGKITYILDRFSADGKFSLDPDTGVLKLIEQLDREQKSHYLLVIEAWDNYQYGFNNGESRNAFKHLNVTVLDVNDNIPQLHVPPNCINITEFHESGQSITTIHASDADDPTTSNGQVIIDIADGNDRNYFYLEQINEWSAELKTTTSLRGRHGNYTLIMRAQDLGTPSHLIEQPINICVIDFNDHPPVFISPPHNSTLRIPENATIGSALIQIMANDEDVGSNGIVRYRLKSDPAGHWKTFNLQPVSGILELRLPLNRKKQKIYDIRIEAYDLGVPTSLSSDLDLTVYVSNVNDYLPQFLIDEFYANFTENQEADTENILLPDTIDRDELEFEGPLPPICYFIINGNDDGLFKLHPFDHILTTNEPLDREDRDTYTLIIKSTEDCSKPPENENFDPIDDTQLKIIINVLDVNDNSPTFIHRVFTGGVSTATIFGTTFMQVKADDPDYGQNAKIAYYLIGRVQMTLTEGFENLQRPPFIVDKTTGDVQLNFDPQQGMKGYFDFMVLANDTGGLQDVARVFIYLLREDQRVRFVLRQQAPELRNRIEMFREILGNVTGAIVNIDEFRVHANHDGSIDKTRTDLYLHLVNRRDNSIIEVDEVLRMVDQNTEKLDELFKEFNVLDTQPGSTMALTAIQTTNTTFWLTASLLFLLLLLLLCLALCINQRQTYQRKLKAATATAYVGTDCDMDGGRGLSILSGRVPNTNKHSMEGSNPIWLQAYENEWYKSTDDFSQTSEHDSLDENVVTCDESITNLQTNSSLRNQNLYQTLPPAPPPPLPRKLETTEL